MSILLIIGWILGFLVWKHDGHAIHLMLVLGIISIILAVTRKPETE